MAPYPDEGTDDIWSRNMHRENSQELYQWCYVDAHDKELYISSVCVNPAR